MSEDLDKKEQFIDRVLSILDKPYIKSLNSMGIDDIDTQKVILSKLFNDDIVIYYGDNYVNTYNSRRNIIYYENSNGEWIKREYDSNGKEIYFENSSGYWFKKEYDYNGKQIYYEDSNGNWTKTEYDSNGDLIYYENSDGLIIDKRNNINESEDKREQFIDKVLSILDKPYIKSLNSIGIDDRDTQKVILSKLFNDNVTIQYGINDISVYNSNGDKVYYEDSNGEWYKREYDLNGNQIYYEDSDGYWYKIEYDYNGKEIYYEDSDGEWSKTEYDSNGNRIYFEDSNGYWEKNEYDSNGNRIYFEDYYGRIVDKRNNINESEDKKEQFINKLLSILDTPYIKSLNSIGIDDEYIQKVILSKLYNDNISIEYGDDDIEIYDSNGNEIYYEDNNGYWIKREYNTYGKRIYYEDSNGEWAKTEYDSNGKVIYLEDSNGEWAKTEYDSNGNEIYFENSRGGWYKYEYDSNGKEIYYEDNNGYWVKREYDSNGNQIYFEDSYGRIIDKRNNINESEDKREQLINKVLSILELPYIKSLNSIGIDDIDTQKVILSRLFNDDVIIKYYDYEINIYNSNGNEIYSEDSEGEWVKYEYDSKGRIVYHESSSGFWMKKEFNSKGNEIYYENSNGYWYKREFDSNGSRIYYEDSDGLIIDKRNNINESEI